MSAGRQRRAAIAKVSLALGGLENGAARQQGLDAIWRISEFGQHLDAVLAKIGGRVSEAAGRRREVGVGTDTLDLSQPLMGPDLEHVVFPQPGITESFIRLDGGGAGNSLVEQVFRYLVARLAPEIAFKAGRQVSVPNRPKGLRRRSKILADRR